MYSKVVYKLFQAILKILIIFLKFCASMENNCEKRMYKFKPFHYEEITPKEGCKIPLGRSGHRIGADSSNFYSFGGYNPVIIRNDENNEGLDDVLVRSYPLFQELWKFNFASMAWHRYSNSHTLPVELASNALILYRNLLMVYGGTGSPFGYRCSNQLYICNINDSNAKMAEIKTWGKYPLPLYGQALVYHNGYLYTIGGTTGISYNCDIHRLNLKTFEWSSVFVNNGQISNDVPEGRYRHEVAFDGENIFILGGGTAHLVYDFDEIPTFNLDEKKWRKVKTFKDRYHGFPPARRCHGAVQINVGDSIQVFIIGGFDGTNEFDDLWKLDLTTYKWTYYSECRLPRELYFHATAATPEGKLYVFGGIYTDCEDIIRTNTIYSTWLCIPKLSEMSWEALLLYFPFIINCDHNVLIKLGLPRIFIKRLPNKN